MKRLSAHLLTLAWLLPAEARLSLAPALSYFHYEEPELMSDQGFLLGAELGWELVRAGSFRVYTTGRGSIGSTQYRGSLQSFDSPVLIPYSTKASNLVWQADLEAQQGFALGAISLGALAGLRAYGVENSQSGFGAYDRSIKQIYLPAGARLRVPMGAAHDLQLSGAYLFFGMGRVVSHLEQAVPGLQTAYHWQSKGRGLEAEIRIVPRKPHEFYGSLRYQEHRVEDSNTHSFDYEGRSLSTIEPANRTRLVSLAIGLYL